MKAWETGHFRGREGEKEDLMKEALYGFSQLKLQGSASNAHRQPQYFANA